MMDRRAFLATCAGAYGLGLLATPGCATTGETLYNGIVLPAEWPPRRDVRMEPEAPPYLLDPPHVIPIDVGRQLFVDDFLIAGSTLRRAFHQPAYFAGNPVLQPDRPWERMHADDPSPSAMVFSDGVVWDPDVRLFRMWYMSGYQSSTSLAISSDGVHWEKPALDVVPGTNIVNNENRDSSTVWRDPFDSNAAARFKMAHYYGNQGYPMRLYESPDGVHWTFRGVSGATGDRTTFFYNPFRRRWVYSLRANLRLQSGRFRKYFETPRFTEAKWDADTPVPWVSVDQLDPPGRGMLEQPELYALDCVAYESIIVGLFSIWRGDKSDRPKLNEIFVGFSRDGFYWSRLNRSAFLPLSDRPGEWNYGNVQSAGGCFTILGDRLHFYVSGRAGNAESPDSGRCTTGLATLRRDGFCSMEAPADGTTGALTTRALRFNGRALFVNADAEGGELRAEILDRRLRTIERFSRGSAVPITSNGTKQRVRWQTTDDLSPISGQTVYFRFWLSRGALYSFWVSPSAEGRSRGYVAAGGPEFAGAIDE